MSEKETVEEMGARMRVFLPNQQKFPLEELARYIGQWIAWHPEGTSIVASNEDPEVAYQRVVDAGYDHSRCVFDFISGEANI